MPWNIWLIKMKKFIHQSKILIIICISLFYFTNAFSEPVKRLFYVRFDVQTKGYQVARSNIMLIPVENEFRAENFAVHVITGRATRSSHADKGISLGKRAEHDALKTLLEHKGLRSLKSKSTTLNGRAHVDTVVSYEGVVKMPGRILSTNYDSHSGVYSVKMEILFAPIAFPDNWNMMFFRNKIKKFFFDLF